MAVSWDSFSTVCDTVPDSCLGGSGRSSIDILDKCYIGGVEMVVKSCLVDEFLSVSSYIIGSNQ